MSEAAREVVVNLNALAAGLFLLTSFGIVAMRQARGCLHLFIAQSLLLAASAALLGLRFDSGHLYGVALVNLITKPIIVPWLLRRVAPAELYTRREIDQVLNIPTALAIALALAIGAYFLGVPLARAVGPEYVGPILYMRNQDGLTHMRRNMIVRIVSRALVLNKILSMLHFANVMIISHDLCHERIGANFSSGGIHHIPHRHTVMISPRSFHHHLLHKWMIKTTQLK